MTTRYRTTADIDREIRENQDIQDSLRKEIDRMPHGYEREGKINLLMTLHDENDALMDQLERV